MVMDYRNVDKAYTGAQPRAGSLGTQIDQGLRSYMLGVYNYMSLALVVTGLVSYFVSQSPEVMATIHGTGLGIVVSLAPLGFILALSFGLNRMSIGTIQILFWAFAAVMGLSLSYIFAAYTSESIFRAFFVTSAAFGSLSLYGYTTKKDLTGFGSFLIMGLVGIIIAGIVNIFLQSTGMQFAISALAVLIFAGLTAYDTQRIKREYYQFGGNAKLAVMGALSLYLDFINIFIHLLSLFGERR